MTNYEEIETSKEKFKEVAASWDQSHKYSPAPRHRRNIILKLLDKLEFSECLDAGCAQPYLLNDISNRYKVKAYGCDISQKVIASNKKNFPNCDFMALDLASDTWIDGKQFDLVISSEVIEHIENWQSAVKNLVRMAKQYVLITVPSGKRRPIDYKLGHYRHYTGDELKAEIEKNGFEVISFIKHGFPMHSLYKRLINFIAPDKIYNAFSSERKYSLLQKIISQTLYYLFYINYFFNSGDQIFVLAKNKKAVR
jgi:SAM-dependent methyltransferase